MTTEIGRVKCWISTERLRQKEVLGRETGMVYNVKTTTTDYYRPTSKNTLNVFYRLGVVKSKVFQVVSLSLLLLLNHSTQQQKSHSSSSSL